jgi:hypothetical protein
LERFVTDWEDSKAAWFQACGGPLQHWETASEGFGKRDRLGLYKRRILSGHRKNLGKTTEAHKREDARASSDSRKFLADRWSAYIK